MDLVLNEKVALVTGGSRGLGRSVCLALAAEGARVAVNYHRSPEIAEGVVRDIQQRYGGRAVAAPGSVADESQIAALFDLVERRLGPVEMLVNNAAVNPRSFVRDTTVEDWSATVQTNLTGTFLTCREMIRRLQADGRAGRVVNVASTAAYLGSSSGRAHYDASKGAVISFTISLAREMAGHGIAVNAVAPSLMHTDMTAERLKANRNAYLARIPLGRFGTTEQVADVIVFLASERAAYMTGTVVNVSGGLLMG